jgi:phosphoglycerate dehydrogenase-like enzyme
MTNKRPLIYIPEMLPPIEPQLEIFAGNAEVETGMARNEADFMAKASQADALLLSSETALTAGRLASCPRLKIVGKYNMEMGNIDLPAATRKGIPVVRVPRYNNAAAELTVGLILAVLRHIQEAKKHIAEGGWRGENLLGDELMGSRVGLIGYGMVAKGVIRKLQGFAIKEFLVFSESKGLEQPEFPNVKFTGLSRLLQASDIVTIHKVLTSKSRGLIGRKEIAQMQKTAYLINTARGGLVDEAELVRALREERLAGAALDVYAQEPLPPDHPLLSLNHVVLTPHLGGSTRKARLQKVTAIAQILVDFLQGKSVDPRYLVNPEALQPDPGPDPPGSGEDAGDPGEKDPTGGKPASDIH